MTDTALTDIQAFINRWHASGAAERANYQLFLAELCDIIGVAHPQPASENPHENAYVFEKRVPSAHGTTNFIDLYKRSCFVLEAKQGSDQQETGQPVFSEAAWQRLKQRKTGTARRGTKAWDTAMEKARQQAQTYARSLPGDEIEQGRPPFIVVVDVGNTIALYSEFSRTGGNYIPFPDPGTYRLKLDDLRDATDAQKARIRDLAEQLDAHRKRQQAQHPSLTLTEMYNVLEKVRAGEPLNAKEQTVHEQGLISILHQLHADLDESVFVAYGWPSTGWPASLSDEETLQRLVDLNAQRAAEEAAGHIRWLRPEYQAPGEVQPQQAALLDVGAEPETVPAPVEKQDWPQALKDRATAVRAVLAALAGPVGVDEVAGAFAGRRTQKRKDEVAEILEMLVALGQIGEENGKYSVR